MADGYLIGAEYLFKSNAQRELGLIAKYAIQASDGLDALQKMVARNAEAFEGFSRFAKQAQRALSEMIPGAERAAKAVDSVSASTVRLGEETATMSARVDTSVTSMTGRYEALNAAVKQTALSMRATAAGGAGGAGTVGAAGAGAAGGAFGRLASGVGGVAGLASLATLAIGTKERANLQDAMIQTALPMGKSDDWVQQNLLPIAMKMSMSTAQSVTDSMGLLRTMATSGINDPRDLIALAPSIARYADTQYLGKNHVPFDQSVSQMAGLAHQLNLRTAADLKPFLNTAYKISNDMPDAMAKAVTQIKYYGGNYAQAGVSPEEVLKLQARADRLGYGGGKSGAGLNMILRNLQKPSTDAMYEAQKALGLIDSSGNSRVIDKTGKFTPEEFFQGLNDTRHRFGKNRGREFSQLLATAFSTNASLIAGSFSSDAGITQGKNVNATLARIPDLEVAQVRLMSSLNSQTKLLASNFSTLAAILGGPLIAPLTGFVKGLSDMVGGTATYLSTHHAVAGLATGALTVGAGFGAVKLAEMLGGLRIFGHLAEHEARHSVGLGASIGLRRGGAHAAQRMNFFEVAGDVFGKISGPLGRFGDVLGELAVKWLPRITIGFLGLETGIPEVIGALMLLQTAFKMIFGGGAANLVKEVRIWWEKNKAGIGYTIGYAFGTISVWLTDAIKGLMTAAGTALAYAKSHWKDLLFDRADFSKGLDSELATQMKNNPGTFMDYFGAGKSAAEGGSAYDPGSIGRSGGKAVPLATIPFGSGRGPTIGTLNVNLKVDPKATAREHAQHVAAATYKALTSVLDGVPNAAASGSGSNRGSALGPRIGSSILAPVH